MSPKISSKYTFHQVYPNNNASFCLARDWRSYFSSYSDPNTLPQKCAVMATGRRRISHSDNYYRRTRPVCNCCICYTSNQLKVHHPMTSSQLPSHRKCCYVSRYHPESDKYWNERWLKSNGVLIYSFNISIQAEYIIGPHKTCVCVFSFVIFFFQEIVTKPQFIVDEATRFDLDQGDLGKKL